MPEIIGVKFKENGKTYYFDPNGIKVEKDQHVIVETAQGLEFGICSIRNSNISEEFEIPLKKLVRIATPEDEKHLAENIKKQDEAFEICAKKIAEHGLEMKLVSVEYTFDNNKILFYFTADGRVDFRQLVKDLASIFRTRIELRQVGVRDEAKILGGLGICGREFCCSGFLNSFQPVSIKMAKEQNLSLNPVKISGTCGRLMCCLKYEQDAYEYLHKISPRNGARVKTPKGTGIVEDVALISGKIKVKLDDSGDVMPVVFDRSEITRIDDGKNNPQRQEQKICNSEDKSE